MNNLEQGIRNLRERVTDPSLDERSKTILTTQLQAMESEQALREMSPQPFYKDEF